MGRKTEVHAADGKQDLLITRIFEIPVELLFKAYSEADLVEQWMGNKVLKLESHTHGAYIFETRDPNGQLMFKANGVIHSFQINKQIVRTFEMENAGFPVQLEFLDFEAIDSSSSQLRIQMVFKSVKDRDNLLKMPFAYGINMAHDRLESIMKPLN